MIFLHATDGVFQAHFAKTLVRQLFSDCGPERPETAVADIAVDVGVRFQRNTVFHFLEINWAIAKGIASDCTFEAHPIVHSQGAAVMRGIVLSNDFNQPIMMIAVHPERHDIAEVRIGRFDDTLIRRAISRPPALD